MCLYAEGCRGEVLEPPGRSRASQAGYPRDQARYPRDQARYPRDQAGYPRDQARYPRDQAPYPRDQARYPRDQTPYPRDQARYPRDRADFGRRRPKPEAGKPRWMLGWGRYPARTGVLMVLAAALLGVAFTVASRSDPGLALGIFVAGGTVAAGISVRSRSAYAIIPVPALTYAAAAVIAGFIHDHAADTSRTALALGAAQWFANGFTAMAVATELAVLIAIARWLLGRLRKRSSPSDLARPHQPARRAAPGRPGPDARPDREDSSRRSMTNFRQPGAAPPAARPSHRRPPPPW
jgi:hypothetical protein